MLVFVLVLCLIGEEAEIFQAKIAHQLRLRFVGVEVDACGERQQPYMALSYRSGREGQKLTLEGYVVSDTAIDLGCHGKEVGVLFRSQWRTN